jgi:predicted nucleotidyltransferase
VETSGSAALQSADDRRPADDSRDAFGRLTGSVLDACRTHYGARLVSLAVFGSVGRGTPRPDSDVDLLIVAADLPRGHTARVEEFFAIERRLCA